VKYLFVITSVFLLWIPIVSSQPVPAKEENIPFLVTFGANSDKSWGDDDFCQIFFFVIPKDYKQPIFIRVFDPDIGGKYDEKKGVFDTKTKFSVYGGKGCITNKDAQNIDPVGNYKSGNLLCSKTFGNNSKYDDKWFTFRPISPTEGEYSEKYDGYVLKVIAQGVSGNDGNLYRYYLSTKSSVNIPLEGSNSFTFEYSFRLHNNPKEVSHIYPYLDDRVISIKQFNFDWDNDGKLFFVSVKRKIVVMKQSPDDKWVMSEHKILEGERKSSLDIQMHKNPNAPANNNNVVFYIRNQYGELLPFNNVPIGGIPYPKSVIKIKPHK